MEIRKLKSCEKGTAMELVWRVFQIFEAPDYPQEGVETFRTYVTAPEAVEALTVYGAFEKGKLAGVLAVRGSHIALFFVDDALQRQGIGKALFRHFLADSGAKAVTVNSSPYAVTIYRHLGFRETAPEQMTDGIRCTPMYYGR